MWCFLVVASVAQLIRPFFFVWIIYSSEIWRSDPEYSILFLTRLFSKDVWTFIPNYTFWYILVAYQPGTIKPWYISWGWVPVVATWPRPFVTRWAWYVAEEYLNGKIRYLRYPIQQYLVTDLFLQYSRTVDSASDKLILNLYMIKKILSHIVN